MAPAPAIRHLRSIASDCASEMHARPWLDGEGAGMLAFYVMHARLHRHVAVSEVRIAIRLFGHELGVTETNGWYYLQRPPVWLRRTESRTTS